MLRPAEGRFSRIPRREKSRGRCQVPCRVRSAGRSEQQAHALLNGASTLPPACQALRRPNNHRHSFELWPTDYRPSSRTRPTSPLPPLHHPPTTRPATMTSSTNMPQITTRTRATKHSPSNPQASPTPQHPSTAVAHRSLSTTRASPPFPTNQRARASGLE